MKRYEEIYREILYQAVEMKKGNLTQSYLAKSLKLSLSVVNLALEPLKRMNAVRVNQRSFDVIDTKKILYYWASLRNIDKDILYRTRADKSVTEIESQMPSDVSYGAYSAYKFRFKDVPADYSEVYVYSNNIDEIKKRFPQNEKSPNIFVLRKDANFKMTMGMLFVDLWNLREWYAADFLKDVEAKWSTGTAY